MGYKLCCRDHFLKFLSWFSVFYCFFFFLQTILNYGRSYSTSLVTWTNCQNQQQWGNHFTANLHPTVFCGCLRTTLSFILLVCAYSITVQFCLFLFYFCVSATRPLTFLPKYDSFFPVVLNAHTKGTISQYALKKKKKSNVCVDKANA